MSRIYVDFHVIQTVPPSCVNRDDTGSPKTAVYGGTIRARVSSQSWKHAMRIMFNDILSGEQLGYRTMHLVKVVSDYVKVFDDSLKSPEKLSEKILKKAGIKITDGKVGALFFISNRQARKLAEVAVALARLESKFKEKGKDIPAGELSSSVLSEYANKYTDLLDDEVLDKFVAQGLELWGKVSGKDVKEKKAAIKDNGKYYESLLRDCPSIDIALFGRMAAQNPSLNYDAAAQVAHSISTHTVHNEYDYFTAVDEYKPDNNAGAGHINTTEFNSSTLYRYATINVSELLENLDGQEVIDAVKAFSRAFICSMPTGKQNSFANRTLPDMVYITVRHDQPVNFAGAFEEPVKNKKEGYVKASEERFISFAKELYQTFAEKPDVAWGIGNAENLDSIAEVVPLNHALDKLEATIARYVEEV